MYNTDMSERLKLVLELETFDISAFHRHCDHFVTSSRLSCIPITFELKFVFFSSNRKELTLRGVLTITINLPCTCVFLQSPNACNWIANLTLFRPCSASWRGTVNSRNFTQDAAISLQQAIELGYQMRLTNRCIGK